MRRPCDVPAFSARPGRVSRTIASVQTTAELRAHLLTARLAGVVGTTREESLRSYRLFAARDPRLLIGLDPERVWSERELLALMAERCGVPDDPAHTFGHDEIDPERTLTALDAFAERLAVVAERGGPVLLGTGHPHRMLGFYAALADALSAAGCAVLTPAQGRSVDITTRFGLRTHNLDYVRESGSSGARPRNAPVVSRAHTRTLPPGSDRARRGGRCRRAASGIGDRRPWLGLRCRSAGVRGHRDGRCERPRAVRR
ncbi:hypothetical protein SHKM778_05660 [Streptomyces sp. KM77-8]|uniref:Phosphatase n=1 Tax=Streptomyces haneummycinicus TaxID=3074435 RepID=A0AAT9H9V7_9ACTN